MSQFPSISKAFEEVVQATEAAIIADAAIDWGTLPKKVHFMAGNFLEITTRLTQMTASPDALIANGKYPLVALLKDIGENIGEDRNGYTTSFNARLLIITLSNPNYRHDDRRDKNFIPILLPVFDKLLGAISRSTNFGRPNIAAMKLKKTNCYFYGTNINNKNQFHDYVDAIYVENISLHLKKQISCNN